MTTRSKPQKHTRKQDTPAQQIAHLRAENARLRAEIRTLRGQTSPPSAVPVLPDPDAAGNYPATETLRAILAQQLLRRRLAAGWTQEELAARAGVRQETVSRLESGKNTPNVATVDKLDRTLRSAGV
jgi:ribosome-binding protein aMBF1 (putative translation factor)